MISTLLGCVKKDVNETTVKKPLNINDTPSTINQAINQEKKQEKQLAASLKFISSLEKEVYKIIFQVENPKVNQFEVLAFAFDKFIGTKPGQLNDYGCQKISVKKNITNYDFYDECIKPEKKLAELIQVSANKDYYKINFMTAHWKAILGSAAGLNPDRHCEIVINESKVMSLDCKNSVFNAQSSIDDINLKEVKIKKYIFHRQKNTELSIEGGWYKDLIEYKKINITVPLSGKVSVIEKEIRIKDDFAEMQDQLLGVSSTTPVNEENDLQEPRGR